jgi:hypothetical protein
MIQMTVTALAYWYTSDEPDAPGMFLAAVLIVVDQTFMLMGDTGIETSDLFGVKAASGRRSVRGKRIVCVVTWAYLSGRAS